MSKINVAILRGGPSSEYDVSLKTGATVLEHLPKEKYNPTDILISKEGVWHMRGVPITPAQALHNVDVVFNAMHGEYGEDGTVQKILDDHGVPYTGSGVFASAIAMDKAHTKNAVGELPNIKTHQHVTFKPDSVYDLESEAERLFNAFPAPYLLKPLRGGSSLGVQLIQTVRELPKALEQMLKIGPVIAEEYIKGREATCGVIENLRDQELYALPPVEIRVPEAHDFWDYEAKYDSSVEEICPGNFTEQEKQIIQEASIEVHKRLGLRHYSRSDFIVTPHGIYFLEVNTLPGLTPTSLLPNATKEIGLEFDELIDHLITQALASK